MGLTYTFWHNFARLFKSLGVSNHIYWITKETNLNNGKEPFDPVSNNTKSIINDALSRVSVNTTATTITNEKPIINKNTETTKAQISNDVSK
ncbi:MAG TPA: hypothetical protein VJ697_09940 [Nitrososphaeraceae archaeon]|nr:hypothetical protein [Nitrososphaeraceae archaeon]